MRNILLASVLLLAGCSKPLEPFAFEPPFDVLQSSELVEVVHYPLPPGKEVVRKPDRAWQERFLKSVSEWKRPAPTRPEEVTGCAFSTNYLLRYRGKVNVDVHIDLGCPAGLAVTEPDVRADYGQRGIAKFEGSEELLEELFK